MATVNDIHRQTAECWNRRDWSGMRALLHSGYEYRSGDGKTTSGPDAGIEVAKMYAAAFPDGRLEVQNVVAQGNFAVAEFLATGTNTGPFAGSPATGKRMTLPICNVIEVRDGKVYREHEYFDTAHLLAQLGVGGPPAK